MSMAISISRMAPAVRSAGSPMPSQASTFPPIRQNTVSMAVAMAQPLIAMARRTLGAVRWVRAANSAAASSGATVAKKVVKATMAVSLMAAAPVPVGGPLRQS